MEGIPLDGPISEANRRSQIQQIEQMHVRQIADVILTGKQVNARLATDLQAARSALLDLALGFAFERFDQLTKDGADLSAMKPKEIARIIREDLQMLSTIAAAAGELPEKLARLEGEMDELKEELTMQRQRAQTAEKRATTLDETNKSLRGTIQERDVEIRQLKEELDTLKRARAQSGETPTVPGNDKERVEPIPQEPKPKQKKPAAETIRAEELDEWYAAWQASQGYDVQSGVIVVLGDTGKCRVADVGKMVQERFSVSRSAYYRALDSCVAKGLISDKKEQLPTGGRPTRVLLLTDKGQAAYQLEAQRDAKPSEYHELIKAHKGRDHLGLILQVHDELERLRFKSDTNPSRILVDEKTGKYFYPDIVAVDPQGEHLYIEVEFGTKRKAKNEAKWANAHVIGAGTIWLVCNSVAALTTHKSEITYWAQRERQEVRVLGTTIQELKAAKALDDMWRIDKKYTPGDRQ